MEKIFIENRREQKICVVVEQPESSRGLAFVMHGLGGFKEQPHIEGIAHVFLDAQLTTIRFDAANTIGESEGDFEDASVTNYLADLEDVIAWAANQSWYQEPFVLAAHSLGGISIDLFAEEHPEKVLALAPIAGVISGRLSMESLEYREMAVEWKKTGWRVDESRSKPGVTKRLPWSHMEDRLKYDALAHADKLTMPVLLVVGTEDKGTPLEHQQILFDALPGKKELHVVNGATHNFREPDHLNQLLGYVRTWIKNVLE